MIVPLVSTLDGMDNSLIEAGYNLGGNGLTVSAADHRALCHARHRRWLHHRLHADRRAYLTPILLGGKNSSWFTEQIYDQFITR